MKDLKHARPTKLLWVDLEMTGLDSSKDLILEIAAEITDFDFTPLASYEAHIAQDEATVRARMAANPWWAEYPANRDDFLTKLATGKPSGQVEQELMALVKEQFGDEPAILAGNSVHADRSFIETHWPELFKLLHYRMLDVTAWKVVMYGKYGHEFRKKETHRAFDDIHESIAELKYYLSLRK
ncbi:MAG TPA: oligoribonuclease [Candidatus Saccharimonadales bacterium]|nr:oligoribonuclease [Candidatus Saccharimonadales bacterium]